MDGQERLRSFAAHVGESRALGLEGERLLERVLATFRPLLTKSILPPVLLEEGSTIIRYLLLRSESITVFAIASPPGIVSAVHDHGSWGLVGQVQGEEIETRYRRDRTDEGLWRLQPTGRHRLRSGDITRIVPPDRDVHDVITVSAMPSISVHAFGRDPVKEGFTCFSPELFGSREFRGLYDNESAISGPA